MSEPRFLCDEMLKGLGRWLRAAGYDTLIAEPGRPDKELINTAIETNRIFVTRDRTLMEIRHASDVTQLLQSNELEDCIQELTQSLNLNWSYAPFTRCLLCNTSLIPADDEQRKKAPSDVDEYSEKVLYCSKCDKVYWEGGHVKRMTEKLKTYSQ